MTKKYRLGVYAGSFNPFHVGHKDILDQAIALFDDVYLAVGNNPSKNLEDRVPLPKILSPIPTNLHYIYNRLKIQSYTGLLSDYLNKLDFDNEGSDVYLVRGLRNGEDLAYEDNQLRYLKSMYPSLTVVFLRCDYKYDHISSSSLKNLRKFSEEEYKKYTFE